MQTKRFAAAAAVGVTMSILGLPTPAHAYDNSPCGSRFYRPSAETEVQYCPDWAPGNQIPVYRYGRSTGDSTVVGHVWAPGDDWYVCQANTGNRYTLGSATNVYWAYTKADNGAWGWVNEVYFVGGNNDEPDRTLVGC